MEGDVLCEDVQEMKETKSMQQTLVPFISQFKETGNYWIDSGIISLFRAFNFPENAELTREMEITIRTREFNVEGKSEENVTAFIKKVVDNLVNRNYIIETQNKDIWYNNETDKFELYQKTNFTPFHSKLIAGVIPSINQKLLLKDMSPDQKEKFNRAIKYFNENKEQKAKIGPKQANNPDKAYVPMEAPKLSIKTTIDLGTGKKRCSFCGRSTSGMNPTGVNYPWVTSPNKLKNFNSMHSGKLVMCGYCEAASLAVYDIVRYHVNGDRLFMALPHAESLTELWRVWNDVEQYAPTRGTETIYCNFTEKRITAYHLSENFAYLAIAMYDSLKNYISQRGMKDDAAWQRLASKRWYASLGVTAQALQFRKTSEFARFGDIFRFFDHVTEGEDGVDIYNLFNDLFVEKKRGISIANVIHREKISERLLNFDDITEEVERFTFEKGRPVNGLHRFVKVYMTKSVNEVIRMEEQLVDMCEKIGDRIGKYSDFSNDKGVLFGLRNSKNLTEFLENLNSAQFKMPNEKYSGRLGIPKEFLLSIDERNWRQYKSLITIFAKNPPSAKENPVIEQTESKED
jgi:hypothetical protein